MSDIAYLLDIDYAKTYRIFDKDMLPKGIININFEEENERFLTLEEALKYIEEESSSFTLTQTLKENVKLDTKEVLDIMAQKKGELINLLLDTIKDLSKECDCECHHILDDAHM